MFTSYTGICSSMSCSVAWTRVTASMMDGDPVTEAKARWKRLSAWRCAAEPDAFVTPAYAVVSSARCSSVRS